MVDNHMKTDKNDEEYYQNRGRRMERDTEVTMKINPMILDQR